MYAHSSFTFQADRYRSLLAKAPAAHDLPAHRLHFDPSHFPQARPELERWFCSPDTREHLANTTSELYRALRHNFEEHAEPGHDIRHVLFLDVAESLRLLLEAKELGTVAETFLLGSLLHDSCRPLQRFLYAEYQGRVPNRIHGELAAQLADACLPNGRALPRMIRNEVLHAVARHSDIQGQGEGLIKTQEADRLQLAGRELYRLIVYDFGLMKVPLIHADVADRRLRLIARPGAHDIALVAEMYMRNISVQSSPAAFERDSARKLALCVFLILIADQKQMSDIFYPELNCDREGTPLLEGCKAPVPARIWKQAQELATRARHSYSHKALSKDELLKQLQPPLAVSLGEYTCWSGQPVAEVLWQRFLQLSPYQRQGLGIALGLFSGQLELEGLPNDLIIPQSDATYLAYCQAMAEALPTDRSVAGSLAQEICNLVRTQHPDYASLSSSTTFFTSKAAADEALRHSGCLEIYRT